MLPALGKSLLYAALAAVIYNVVTTIAAYRGSEQQRAARLASAYRAALASFALLSAAGVVLWALFLGNDFSVDYVTNHSTRGQALLFKISALWGGQDGSLLLWAWMLSLYIWAVARSGRKRGEAIAPPATSVLCAVDIFFISLVAFVANPFTQTLGSVPKDGRGLNPLLQNYWMQIHPPTLYAGYVGCTVPFAFAVAALLHRKFDSDWVNIVRRWTLVPWLILTLGIIMGGAWAYETLGWGGYWAWDPVENASLLPWLTATAFLHSVMIQARRGMLKAWNMVLVSLTFLLSVFGTFLTRSGVVSSVHSFANSGIGPYFMTFLALALVFSFGLIIWRRDDLASTAELDSPLSREGAFLLNNWILLGSTFAVLWGTVYPSIRETLTGEKITVGAPYFNKVMVPLGLVLLALTGVGPLMSWRRASLRSLARVFRWPVLIALLVSPLMVYLSRLHTGAATSFCLSAFVVAAIGSEWIRGARARHSMTGESLPEGFVNLVRKNKQRYGGYVVHIGVVIFFIGVTGSSAFKIEKEPIQMKPGQELKIGEYTVRYLELERPELLDPDKSEQVRAHMLVLRGDKPLADMYPKIDIYKPTGDPGPMGQEQEGQMARRPFIRSTFSNDLYLVLTQYDTRSRAVEIKSYLNPLVKWVWISTLFFIGGSIIAWFPDKKRVGATEAAKDVEPIASGANLGDTPALVALRSEEAVG